MTTLIMIFGEISVCNLPQDMGLCRGRFKKYYFDSETQQCSPFIYGGCRGNNNRFDTIEECEETCSDGASGSNLSEL